LRRVAKLERAAPSTLMARYYAALNDVALRVLGKPYWAVESDPAALTRVSEALGEDFVRSLNEEELTAFAAELERLIEITEGDAERRT